MEKYFLCNLQVNWTFTSSTAYKIREVVSKMCMRNHKSQIIGEIRIMAVLLQRNRTKGRAEEARENRKEAQCSFTKFGLNFLLLGLNIAQQKSYRL